MVSVPRFLLLFLLPLLLPLFLSVAVVSSESAVGTPVVAEECTAPGTCSQDDVDEETDEEVRSLRDLLQSLVSKRTLVKRGKQDSGIQGFSSAEKQAIVDIHNQLRKSVNPPASNMLEMSWDDELGQVANNYAKKCVFEHNSNRNKEAPSFTSVGENIYAHSNSYDEKGAVQSWYDEDQYYNYYTGACSHVCGHYTQVVWAKSNKVGCGVKYCNPLRGVSFGSGYIIVCNYGPAGNYRGVKPYEEGQGSTSLEKSPDSSGSKTPSGSSTDDNTTTTTTTKTRKSRRRKNKKNRGRKRKGRKSKSNKAQPSTTSQSDQPQSSSDQKQKLSRTCRRGRQQILDLKNDLEQDVKDLQPGSSPWRQRLSSSCSRSRQRLEELKKALEQQNSPTSSGSQPSTDWRRSLSSKCRRGRQQTLDLKNELQQDMKSLQPGTSPWRVKLSSSCSRGRQRLEELRKSLQQQNSPTSSGSQPSSSWRPSLSSTCRRGRQQTLDLKNELQQDMKSLQPGTSPWRVRLSSSCSRGRQRLSQLRSSLQQSRNGWWG